MTRNAMLPPFLQKLHTISESAPMDVADWSEDGLAYIVKDNDRFGEFLKNHFKGNLQTFVRQLHFYGFKKLDVNNGAWSFIHENFRKGKPELLSEIRRKTRSEANATNPASQGEVQALRSQVAYLQDVVEELQTKLENVLTVLDDAGVSPITATTEAQPPAETKSRKRQRQLTTTEAEDIEFSFGTPSIEPLPVDSDFDSLFSDEDMKSFFAPNELVRSESTMSSETTEMDDVFTSAEAVATATELDPKSVSKVLAYLRKAISDELSKKSKPGVEFTYTNKNPIKALPAQEVGAN